jgi:hypothetical protein
MKKLFTTLAVLTFALGLVTTAFADGHQARVRVVHLRPMPQQLTFG